MASYYANWELVEEKVQYETRKKTFTSVTQQVVVYSWRQVRPVILKTYEATIQDTDPSVAELPAPSYVAGTNYLTDNPENLSPTGWESGQWHIADSQYAKQLSEPLSRRARITWEQFGNWQTIDTDESSSQ